MMTLEEHKKYIRQINLPGFGLESQLKLRSSKVLVIGLGGLGSPISLYLAASGIGTLGIMDFDQIDLSNLSRQILYLERDIGRKKIDVGFSRLSDLNSCIKIVPIEGKLNAQNIESIFSQYELIIDGSDNFETRYLVNDTCIKMNLPFIHGSISGFEGFVSIFNASADSPCLRCLHPDIPQGSPNCSSAGVLPTTAGIVGLLMAHEAINFLVSFTPSYPGKVFMLRGTEIEKFVLPKDPLCPGCGLGKILNEKSFEINYGEFEKIRSWCHVVDIREPWEFEEKNLGGINIPYPQFNLSSVSHLKNQNLLLVCYSGEKSKHLLLKLKNENFKKIFNLKGGIREAFLNLSFPEKKDEK